MKTRNKVLSLIAWLPAIFMIVFIFALSSQDGQTSYYTSAAVAQQVVKKDAVTESLNSIIRSCAHVSEYAVLSLFIGMAMTANGFRGKMRSIYMILLGGLVSALDEFYQIFIPDRYGDLIDILSDELGISFIAIAWYLITYSSYKKKLHFDDAPKRVMFSISIDNLSFEQAVQRIMELAGKGDRAYVVTPNVDHVVKLKDDKDFRESYDNASLILTDGTPLMWLAESLGHPFLERIAGADLMPGVCEAAAKHGRSVFLLGAEEGVAALAASKLKAKYKGLIIKGTYSPRPGFEDDEKELNHIFELVSKASPDILILGLGSPKQEIFISKYREKMNFGIALCVGAAIDFEAGNAIRAPRIVQKLGLEWLFRFLQEPGRMFRRYFIDDIKIFYMAYAHRDEIIEQKL